MEITSEGVTLQTATHSSAFSHTARNVTLRRQKHGEVKSQLWCKVLSGLHACWDGVSRHPVG